jgi:hypothetical protein
MVLRSTTASRQRRPATQALRAVLKETRFGRTP